MRPVGTVLPSPAAQSGLDAAEQRMGVNLPAAVRQVYAGVANGGFGPGYGLVGMSGGTLGFENVGRQYFADEHYLAVRADIAEWPEGLIPWLIGDVQSGAASTRRMTTDG